MPDRPTFITPTPCYKPAPLCHGCGRPLPPALESVHDAAATPTLPQRLRMVFAGAWQRVRVRACWCNPHVLE